MNKLMPVVLIILLLGGGFYYLFKNQTQKTLQTATQPTSVSPTSATNSASDVTAVSGIAGNFYKDYDSCMKNSPAVAKGRVSEYCQNNTGLTTVAFAANLEKGGTAKAGADPIFCAQNVPESVNVNPDVQITGDRATVFVSEKMGPTEVKIQVSVFRENGVWKIDNITCSLP